jgi:hypothetical protein
MCGGGACGGWIDCVVGLAHTHTHTQTHTDVHIPLTSEGAVDDGLPHDVSKLGAVSREGVALVEVVRDFRHLILGVCVKEGVWGIVCV